MEGSQIPSLLLRPWVINFIHADSCHTTLSHFFVAWLKREKELFTDMMPLVVMTKSSSVFRVPVKSSVAQFSTTNSMATIIWIQSWHRIDSKLKMLLKMPFTQLLKEIFTPEIMWRWPLLTAQVSRLRERKSEKIDQLNT